MFDFADDGFTHMPFVAARDDGRPQQFCCKLVAGVWKVHYCTAAGVWRQYNTGLPADFTECGPCAEFADGVWKVSFIAGGGQSDRRFFLYRCCGILPGNGKPEKVIEANVGFVWKAQAVYAGRRGDIWLVESDLKTRIAVRNLEYLYRVSYNPQRPRQLLISGKRAGDELVSIAYVPGSQTVQVLQDDGRPCYKAALWDGVCYYAMQGGREFEDRHIVAAQTLTVAEEPAADYIAACTHLRQQGTGSQLGEEFV